MFILGWTYFSRIPLPPSGGAALCAAGEAAAGLRWEAAGGGRRGSGVGGTWTGRGGWKRVVSLVCGVSLGHTLPRIHWEPFKGTRPRDQLGVALG